MPCTLPVISVNGVLDAQISPLDRGFAYGDGLFETCRMSNGKIPLWRYHSERLKQSAKQLFIPVDLKIIEDYLQSLIKIVDIEDAEDAVVKIIISRGVGGRGYKQPEKIIPTICIGVFPGVRYSQDYYHNGINVKLCQQRLSVNIAIAGLKHLNRLEQILARAEWQGDNYSEGILLNTRNHVIEGTASNLFVVKDGKLLTPDLQESGVAGVMRRYLIDDIAPSLGTKVEVVNLSLEDVFNADELFLCNSVYGIWPVKTFDAGHSVSFTVGAVTQQLQQALNEK